MPRTLRSRLWYDVATWSTKFVASTCFGLRTEGKWNVPLTGPALVVANHQSFLDPALVADATRRRLRFLARKTLFDNPVFGRLIASLGAVPVDQEGIAKEGLKTLLKLLEQGEAVVVFPEGERSADGNMIPLKPGILLVLKRLALPVVPVGIAGAFECYPRGATFPRFAPIFVPAERLEGIAVSVGKPIDSRTYQGMTREDTLSALFGEIARMKARAEQLRLGGSRAGNCS
jgi:1-acyl-sn-glycerol-3-phosphate acyltransferase